MEILEASTAAAAWHAPTPASLKRYGVPMMGPDHSASEHVSHITLFFFSLLSVRLTRATYLSCWQAGSRGGSRPNGDSAFRRDEQKSLSTTTTTTTNDTISTPILTRILQSMRAPGGRCHPSCR